MSKTTVYLPLELQHGLRDESRRSGRPQAELIREAITEFLGQRKRPLPRSLGIVADGSLDAGEAKAWLRESWGSEEPN